MTSPSGSSIVAFIPPTMSWPVAGTLMIEPTESETKAELDRFCDAMLAIREEARAIEKAAWIERIILSRMRLIPSKTSSANGTGPIRARPLAFPAGAFRVDKYWPPVNRVDNVYGDRNLVCTCPTMDMYVKAAE